MTCALLASERQHAQCRASWKLCTIGSDKIKHDLTWHIIIFSFAIRFESLDVATTWSHKQVKQAFCWLKHVSSIFFWALSFSVFSVFQSRSLCWDPKRQNFSFFQRQWLLFRWIFWVCILGFSIALISNVARILIHKWTVEAAWQLKISAGFWALAFPSCFEICFDLALSILFVHVSKVHDLDSLNDPLIEHVLLDTGSRPWKRPYATFTPRTRHDVTSDWWWMARLMSHELPSPLHFCWPCWVARGHRAEQFFFLCATKLHWIARLLACLAWVPASCEFVWAGNLKTFPDKNGASSKHGKSVAEIWLQQ